MSSPASFDTKERVRQAIDIVELVGSYLQLRREGRNYKALCPWHDDTRPSLHVNPERQSFKCWVCDIGGDIFSFMMKMENVAFPEALSMLAERAGIPLKASHAAGRGAEPDEKRPLYQALAWAEGLFHQCLLTAPEAEPARRYLADRHIEPDSLRRFCLGFSPDRWDWIIKQALSTEISPKVLESVGLIAPRQDGPGHYDRFRGRVLFPIRDVQGRPVAFGGRILPQTSGENLAKYINSPETSLFSKSSMLYALDTARDAMGRGRVAVVMEGYTDTIVARQFGFDNTVAVLGTALGERHIRLLRRFADTIVLVLDGDEAGQRRANEILGLFVAEQADLRVVTLPENLDPADFLLQRGPDAFRQFLDGAIDALEHRLAVVGNRLGPAPTTHQVNLALEEILATLARAPRLQANTPTQARLREHQVLARLSRQYGVVEEELRARLRDLRRSARRPAAAEAQAEPSGETFEPLSAWENELLQIVLVEPEAVAAAAEVIPPDAMHSATGRLIFGRCCELSQAGITPDFDRLLLEFDDPAVKNLLVGLDEQVRAKQCADVKGWLRELLQRLQSRDSGRQMAATVRSLKEKKHDPHDELAILKQLVEQERTRQGISSPTDG